MPRTDRPADGNDASRREFFRTFSRQTVHNAGAVLGAATELRRSGMEVARELLGPESAAPGATPHSDRGEAGAERHPAPDWSYRSAYRFVGDAMVLLDQRELPQRVTTITVRDVTEIASAIRSGVVNGGPVAGQVAAYAMVLAARAALHRPETGRQGQIRAAAGTLRSARRELQVITSAINAMEARYDAELDAGAGPAEVIAALESEADALASAATTAHAAIGRLAAESLVPADRRGVVQLLMHGDLGPLSCAMVGISTAMVRALADAGLGVHAWLTEAAPGREGARIAALQLAQHDVPHTVIPDAAVGWLFANRLIDAAILRGDRLAANGDTGTIVGGLAVAQLAAAARVPVLVLAPSVAVDASAQSGEAMRSALSSSAEALAERVDRGSIARHSAVVGVQLNPSSDIVPAALISRIVTETGILTPPLDRGGSG